MAPGRLTAIAIFLTTVVVSGYATQRSPSRRPWPPGVQAVSDDSPPLPPEAALQTFYTPPGYHVELVASEPLIQDPVAIDWDTEGRLWAVEMPGFMTDVAGSNEHDPIGRIVVLTDTNADGVMDRRTIFVDGLVLARSLKVLDRGVLVAEPPNVWLMRDTDGDLRVDVKELVTDRFGRRETDPENNANTFYWALDNRLYTSGQTTLQFRPRRNTFELEQTLQRGEWGVAQDDAGHLFRNTNEYALHVDYVTGAYYARNPNLLRTRGLYERTGEEDNELNTVWPVRPNPGTNRAYQTGIDRPDGSLAKFTAACAPVVYTGDRLPSELYGNVFVAEPAANLVSRLVLSDDGRKVRARKAYARGEFLASTDERFRPVYLSNAPDGTLYIVDMYRGTIEHRLSLTVYLRDQILKRKLETPTGYGRIYRVVHETTRRDTRTTLSQATPLQLADLLADPGGWRRDTAQRLLVERADRLRATPGGELSRYGESVVARLTRLTTGARDWRTRLRALWTLDGIDALDPALVIRALEDRSGYVRVSAVRLAERWLGTEAEPTLRSAVLKRLDDEDWGVRRQLAATLGAMSTNEREEAVVLLLQRYGDDPITLDAALSGLPGGEAEVLERLMTSAVQTPQLDAAITMFAATVMRGGEDGAVQRVFEMTAADRTPQWQQAALLRGAEVALLGALVPGTVAARAEPVSATLPCPTCPGGRAGPGGAYAFSTEEDFVRAGLRGGRGRIELRLSSEPTALSRMAAGGGESSVRAAALLARVAWPGKAGFADAPPLSPEEQQRFDAGREIYRNICQACHQPDGRGQERVAPSLVGSSLLFAQPGVPVRILLNGKEGTIGLMPPIGFALNDDQIAAVLTYVRREWNQTGTAVDPATVKAVRAATADRTRPWTNGELLALAKETAR